MNCQWMGPAFYTGCLPPDQDILKFPFFDSDSVLDLRCTHVRSVFIENSSSICSDIDILTTQGKSFSLFIDDKLCVSQTKYNLLSEGLEGGGGGGCYCLIRCLVLGI
ncbi:hypothetical protein FSP39_007901 [Pinctada imbricata]|uniref:Uncharacterized protein n=1 Tax=Pinctada imbricata TaxID=66713 RepID=A0AA89C5L7_PINIB|nr:hypothetical protein FSP39_007901 [Pinctada imbricata]